MQVNGEPVTEPAAEGWLQVRRAWRPGDELVLNLPLDVRFTRADPRVDADRGAVAIERGPLVYCLDAVDNPGHRLDDVVLDPSQEPRMGRGEDLLGGVTTIFAHGAVRPRPPASSWWPYAAVTADGLGPGEPRSFTAVPYFAWGNREEGAMRVWLPAE